MQPYCSFGACSLQGSDSWKLPLETFSNASLASRQQSYMRYYSLSSMHTKTSKTGELRDHQERPLLGSNKVMANKESICCNSLARKLLFSMLFNQCKSIQSLVKQWASNQKILIYQTWFGYVIELNLKLKTEPWHFFAMMYRAFSHRQQLDQGLICTVPVR